MSRGAVLDVGQSGAPPDQPVILSDYTAGRAQEVLLRPLEGYRGNLMTDDYAATMQ